MQPATNVEKKELWGQYWQDRSKVIVAKLLMKIRMRFGSKGFIRTALKYSDCKNVLEAGCGTAISSIKLALTKKDCKLIGIDLEDRPLIMAKAESARYKVSVALTRANIFNLPFKDRSVDLVWNMGTLQFFDDPVPAIKEMMRVSQVAIGFVPADSFRWRLYNKLTKGDDERYKLYSKQELKTAFDKAGFSEVKVDKVDDCLFPFYAGIGIR